MKLASRLILLLALLFAGEVAAAVRHVPADHATIQAAVDACAVGDVVLVAPGTYHGLGNRDIDFHGVDLTVISEAGPEQTILDCDHAGRGFLFRNWETPAARVSGFTIQNGMAPDDPVLVGGGIMVLGSSPTIDHCVITHCSALMGGGAFVSVSEGSLMDCTITKNSAYGAGGGGGLYLQFADGLHQRCVVIGNFAPTAGGVYCNGLGTGGLQEFTICSNDALGEGGGVLAFGPLLLDRCIVWGNFAGESSSELRVRDGEARCCDVLRSGVDASGDWTFDDDCIDADPLFCDPIRSGDGSSDGDWTLNAGSPCLPEHSLCGELIGALGVGCGAPPATGACCLSTLVCTVTTEQDCAGQSGDYQGDDTDCDPNPCVPVAVESSSWGRIKARYGR